MDGQSERRRNERAVGRVYCECMYVCASSGDGWMDRGMDGWTDGSIGLAGHTRTRGETCTARSRKRLTDVCLARAWPRVCACSHRGGREGRGGTHECAGCVCGGGAGIVLCVARGRVVGCVGMAERSFYFLPPPCVSMLCVYPILMGHD